MPPRSPTVPVRYIAFIVAYAESLGLEHHAILAAAGLPNAGLSTMNSSSLTIVELDAVLSAIARLTGRTDLGFEVGLRITLDLHGPLGSVIQRCANLDQALALASRYFALLTPSFAMDYQRDHKRGRVAYRPLVGMTHETLCSINEMHAVSFHCLVTAAVAGCLPPYDIYLPMDPPAHALRYRKLAPARVHFGPLPLPEVRIEFDATMIELPFALADPRYVSQAEGELDRRFPRIEGKSSWSDWVILMLQEAEDCQPTLSQLAEFIGIGHHTLARRLAEEGWSFRRLSNHVRHQRACRLLRDSRTPISQIAYRLGYADIGNFSNAFRRAAGVSPRQYRISALAA
ncbi:MAG: AraC family transcriptional regulator ligand-binding domain-containing protein [Candidatus Competibacter sp.]|nr:AraC family transcriptional regulator ligand-binding domain-containing protein [Candidatus Competibacter sp.]MDG4583531.1 AraC family transcriptional regulator ligand-binding domain-containing protein [Candidatus Competibacter sp.]